MLNFKKLSMYLLIAPLLISCNNLRQVSSQSFGDGFMSATIVYIGSDTSSMNFTDIAPSKYNDLILLNILTKTIMYQTHAEANENYDIKEIPTNALNSLCLASVFTERYNPLNKKLNKHHLKEAKQYLIDLRFSIKNELETRTNISKKNCLKWESENQIGRLY